MFHEDQHFAHFDQWVSRASSWLTCHERYNEGIDWSEPRPFVAICFDSKGRLCRKGSDFMRARDENSFPVYWLWPDQIGAAVLGIDDNG